MNASDDRRRAVTQSLQEDIGSGDITAELIDESVQASATVIAREQAVVCGVDWFAEVYAQLDPRVELQWKVAEGDCVEKDTVLVNLLGSARTLLTGERCALNWLQTLSGTATRVKQYVDIIADSQAVVLDTRKTIPGLRLAQKHAVTIGGGANHRVGLFDAFLIKENHLASCSGIEDAIKRARKLYAERPIEIEVENMSELKQALNAGADIVMLDNFSLKDMAQAVAINNSHAKLEASGNVDVDTLQVIAATGVDRISIGGLTKHLTAIDLSMRFDNI